jgi:hypothetical protein
VVSSVGGVPAGDDNVKDGRRSGDRFDRWGRCH